MTNSTPPPSGSSALSETISLCVPLFGTHEMAVTSYREADDRYQRERRTYRPQQPGEVDLGVAPKAPYRPQPSVFDLGVARGRRRRRRELRRAFRRFHDVERCREAMEAVRTDLSYHLFKADHLTQAIAQRHDHDLPPLRGLLGAIRRLRGRVEGCTTPWELEFPVDEAGQRQRREHRKEWDHDIDELVRWRQDITDYEDTSPALADGSASEVKDLSAYTPASELAVDEYASSIPELHKILKAHPWIQTHKVGPRRFSVHAGDWNKYKKQQDQALHESSIETMAAAVAARATKERESHFRSTSREEK